MDFVLIKLKNIYIFLSKFGQNLYFDCGKFLYMIFFLILETGYAKILIKAYILMIPDISNINIGIYQFVC